MGYILAGLMMVIVLGMLIAALTRVGSKPPKGTLSSERPVVVEEPAADEPTPGESIIATNAQADRATRHTPSA